ncbi:MAG: NAD-dependent epimerase/dehydratase family protein [Pseudomonadota bacterium]
MLLRLLVCLALVALPCNGLNILLLGGNGLIGGHTSRRLFEAGHRLTSLSRGSLMWDWNTVLAGHFQQKLRCNRADPLSECTDFQKMIASRPFFDIVLDFSGFEQHMIDSTVPALKFMFDRYIFISTDSVYEVARTRNHTGPWREQDAVRPDDYMERRALQERDRYAEMKMRCEEQLAAYAKKFNFTAVFLRLPDVLGPRDSTLRLWTYIVAMQIAAAERQTLQLPNFAPHWQISFVHADDVARVLVLLTNSNTSGGVWPQAGGVRALNFAHPETMTLRELLTRLVDHQRLAVATNVVGDPLAEKPRYLFPSVKNGPIDVTLVRRALKFSFTAWHLALRASVKFYQQQTAGLKRGRWPEMRQRLYDSIAYVAVLPHFNEKVWKRYLGMERSEL